MLVQEKKKQERQKSARNETDKAKGNQRKQATSEDAHHVRRSKTANRMCSVGSETGNCKQVSVAR